MAHHDQCVSTPSTLSPVPSATEHPCFITTQRVGFAHAALPPAIILAALLTQPAWWVALAVALLGVGTVWWQAKLAHRTHLVDRNTLAALHADQQHAAAQLIELKHQRAHLDAILEATPQPMLVCAQDGLVERANQPLAQLIARPPAELVGCAIEDLFTHSQTLALYECARAGSPARDRVKLPGSDPIQWFDVTCVPLHESAAPPPAVIMTLTDVTDLAVAVQLKADFAANAGHELRTPVAAIRTAADTLQPAAADPAMTARLHEIISTNVARLEALLADLLDLSRLESPEAGLRRKPVSASALCADIHAQLAPALDDYSLRLTIDLDPALDDMLTDPLLLELILRNLIDNAIKFARQGTAIKVVGRTADITPDEAAPWQAPDSDETLAGAAFRVTDKGTGIPLADQQRIFERFYQADPSRDAQSRQRGTGLGLAIVKHALRRLGGRITVQSVWQQGTTMSFEIPHCVECPDDPAS